MNPICKPKSVRRVCHRRLLLSLLLPCLLGMPSNLHGQPQASGREKLARFEEQFKSRLAAILPKKIKLRDKPPVARWEDVDTALLAAWQQLDVANLLRETLQSDPGRTELTLTDEQWNQVDRIFSENALPYNRLFLIDKKEKTEIYFPLTNNVLRFADDRSLDQLSVFDRTAFSLGQYLGKFFYERAGGLTARQGTYRLTFFQYRDNADNVRSCGNINLLDTFSVLWSAIREKSGFLLHSSLFDPNR